MLEERGHVPVVGMVPYMELSIDDEDSLSSRFEKKQTGLIDIAVIRYPLHFEFYRSFCVRADGGGFCPVCGAS